MKRIVFLAILFISILSIINSVNTMYHLWKKRDVLIATQNQLQKEQTENKTLKNELKIVSQQAFIEEEARNKLFLIKPGENTVFIPKELITTTINHPLQVRQSNWDQWIKVFFN